MREKREQRKVIEKLRKNLVILKDSNFEYSIFNIKRHDNLYDTRRLLRESEERISILRVNIENKRNRKILLCRK